MSHNHHTEKTQEHPKTQDGQPKTHDGMTAPQEVEHPGKRTTPAGGEKADPDRLERAREEQDRTIAT